MSYQDLDALALSRSLLQDRTDVELTEAPQCDGRPSTSPYNSIDPATEFDFPTLTPDGSVADLAVIPTIAQSRTPPAALSSGGAKLRTFRNMSDSGADSDYDMVDDVSETSLDDQDTASFASTERAMSEDGQLTPDDTDSIVDTEEELQTANAELENDTALLEPSDTVGQVLETLDREENALLDSYLTEDLDTPRQSVLTPSPQPAAKPLGPSHRSLRVLFVSDRGVTDEDIAHVCSRVASALTSGAHAFENATLTRLPPTPSGINPTSSVLLRVGDIELVIEHCVGAERYSSSPESYALRIQDADQEHTSIFTVGKENKIELQTPDLVIYYLTPLAGYPSFFSTVKKAMVSERVPSLTTASPVFDSIGLTEAQQQSARENCDVVLSNRELFGRDDAGLRGELESLMDRKQKNGSKSTTTKVPVTRSCEGPKMQLALGLSKRLFPIFLMAMIVHLCFYAITLPTVDPVAELAIRRDALSTALSARYDPDPSKIVNVEYLLPTPTDQLSTEQSSYARFQAFAPNYFLVSLPKQPKSRAFPYKDSTMVYKNNGFQLDHVSTKLIEGVYEISFPSQDAHGLVMASMLTQNPAMNVTMSHNFGSKMLQRQTYQKASTGLSKTLSKDVTVAKQSVKSLKEMVGLELNAGAVATKNVTSELAIYVVHDLQVFTNTAISVFGKAIGAGNKQLAKVATAVRKEKQDVVRSINFELHWLKKNLRNDIASTKKSLKAMIPSKKLISGPLETSRKRALSLKQKLIGGKMDTNSTSASTELALHFENLWNPSEKTKRAGSLPDIARCANKKDYQACRREQRKQALAKNTTEQPKAKLADVVDKAVVVQQPSAVSTKPQSAVSVKEVTKKAEAQTKKGSKKKVKEDMEQQVKEGWKKLKESRKKW
ncbi:hypothetical protein LTR37_003084 [Vermiconidia calcicola]|uniref:Uncharacterized protein n=1 Tax=Vermiconidia calcicola TaxID=1690605 RepID=A0ACC3NS86_9PEZI|nr:hypothetical protein LTR37_003084 [Vermiconidia calcicola]